MKTDKQPGGCENQGPLFGCSRRVGSRDTHGGIEGYKGGIGAYTAGIEGYTGGIKGYAG